MRKCGMLMILPLLLLLLAGCSRETMPLEPRETEITGGRLICAAETEEQAREIGALYGIELLDYQYGLALYFTEEDPNAVIKRGREQGWPELSLDRQLSIS